MSGLMGATPLEMAEVGAAGPERLVHNGNTPVTAGYNRGLREVMGSLDVGTRKHLDLLLVA